MFETLISLRYIKWFEEVRASKLPKSEWLIFNVAGGGELPQNFHKKILKKYFSAPALHRIRDDANCWMQQHAVG